MCAKANCSFSMFSGRGFMFSSRALSTIKVHLVSISACHVGIDRNTISKRVGEFHAMSVHKTCVPFAMDFLQMTPKTYPPFVPKVSESALACREVDLLACHLLPFPHRKRSGFIDCALTVCCVIMWTGRRD